MLSWQLDLPCEATRTLDAYGNVLHVLTLDRPHQLLEIAARRGRDSGCQRAGAGSAVDAVAAGVSARHAADPAGRAIRDFARRYWQAEKPLASRKLMDELLLKMPYQPGSTQVSDSAAKVFAAGSGVCRSQRSPAVAAGDPGALRQWLSTDNVEHVATHARVEARLDGSWHSFDITNNTRSTRQHLRLAVGVDYLDACPVRGIRLGGGGEDMLAVAAVQQVHGQQ